MLVGDRGDSSGHDRDRGTATKDALLVAARECFCEYGFSETSIGDVVRGAGKSVGSVYHHFGGKADLYFALFEAFDQRQARRAAAAVRGARDAGQVAPCELFLVGARSYLLDCWEERDLARLFLAGDGPPGFDSLAGRRHRRWARGNQELLAATPDVRGKALTLVLTGLMCEAGREVAVADSADSAVAFIDEVLALLAKLVRE